MSGLRIRFARPGPSGFVSDVRTRVDAYFAETGRSRHADARMVLKTIAILTMTFGPYALIMTGLFTPWQMLGLAVLMGAGMAGMGFSVSHDALHGAYSANPRVNRWLGYTFDLVGANGYMWKITHNVIHHTYTNIHGVDEDLTVSPLLRLSPEARRYWFHGFQHIYGLLAYGFVTLNWLFAKDFRLFRQRELGPYSNKMHSRKEVAIMFVSKLLAYTYMIALPLIFLDLAWWQVAIGFVAMHYTAGVILGVIFQLAHVVEGPDYPVPDEKGQMEHAWVLHEMHTTANFAEKNKVLSWYVGGLNYQIEHHLFPQVCSIHYPAISPLVRAAAKEHGVPYHYHATLREAVGSHLRMLRMLGRPVSATAAVAAFPAVAVPTGAIPAGAPEFAAPPARRPPGRRPPAAARA